MSINSSLGIRSGNGGVSSGFNAADIPSAYMRETNNTPETTTLKKVWDMVTK